MPELRIGIVTCSDTRTAAEDTAGIALREAAEARGWQVVAYRVVPDEFDRIAGEIVVQADSQHADVILTCGGTGLSPRDVTPEATLHVAKRPAPGIAEHIRAESLKITGRAMLSRAVAAVRGTTLVINLPGSKKAATESFGFVADQLEHAVEMMAGGGHG
ncbi:MAG TPA: MogA/MoaB family molybdenum cofactor biosynthesis protein [Coriobacteriia bacterium]|nr:MogA/MoaB family molybdenum cofactor biosynthesis protein [Coriobacteriia bacterium]